MSWQSPSRFPTTLYVRQISLETRDIAYDPTTRRLFASVGPSVRGRENSITAIDPLTGTIGTSVFIGSDPTRLAIAAEGKWLYVLLNGANSLRRFYTPTRTPEAPFTIGTNAIEDMIVPTGHPDRVVVARYRPGISPRHGGGALYVNGVEQPGGYQWGPNVFVGTPDGDYLYGLYNELGGSGIGKREISATGWGGAKPFLETKEDASDVKYDAGKLFASSGRVYDFRNPTLLGTCPGGGGGPVAPQEKDHRVYFLQHGEGDRGWRFHAFDTRTFTSLGWMDIPGIRGNVGRLVKWGEDSFSFRTSGGQIFFISPFPDIFTAAETGNVVMLRLLLDKGANPNAPDESGKSPLLRAAARGQTESARLLLLRGADVNSRQPDGTTALFLAGISGDSALVSLLLAHGAVLNARQNDGYTVLMRCILAGRREVARLLIARGADVCARAANGDTALKLATLENQPTLIPLLRRAGAQE